MAYRIQKIKGSGPKTVYYRKRNGKMQRVSRRKIVGSHGAAFASGAVASGAGVAIGALYLADRAYRR